MRINNISAALLLAVFFPLQTHAVRLLFEPGRVEVPYGQHATVTVTIQNESHDEMCFEVNTSTSDARIVATPSIPSVCVEAKTAAEFSLDVACYGDAEPGTSFAEVTIRSDSVSLSQMVDVVVEED